ncbi:hypothetical protein NUW58_g2522 [Xylaria curta]|uniref:Uncharacterized protein n=1 Tax=Xylaria curta TaxID=42375 RepID=A0ACC1PHU8_9PEZI|nr:hypothetical protein NUW58_g2522 [Xylaria curta]
MAWRKDPRPEDHRALHVPWVDWDVDYRHYKWHFWKFGYKQEDIFGSLHAEYNCMAFAIQDPYAWHTDVCQLSIACKNREEFHAALIKRRDERFKEIRTAWLKTQDELGGDPRSWESPNLNRPLWQLPIAGERTRRIDIGVPTTAAAPRAPGAR